MRFELLARYFVGLMIAVALSAAATARAETALVAVASNFAEAATEIVTGFEAATGHHINVSLGATGKIYAQIHAGAPYDAFLSADQARPAKLEAEVLAVPGSRFTYATGQLTLWSANPGLITGDVSSLLASTSIRAIAIANPALAPYGLAAEQTLKMLGLWSQIKSRLVTGENIGQAFALVATGNADVGFIARPLLHGKRGRSLTGSHWDVPANLHDPIKQDAVLLARGRSNKAARAFLAYLQSGAARAVIVKLGYQARTD